MTNNQEVTRVICIDNEYLEDTLVINKEYKVIPNTSSRPDNVVIEEDNGSRHDLFKSRFRPVSTIV